MSINQIEQTFEQMSETILTRSLYTNDSFLIWTDLFFSPSRLVDNVGRRIDEFERKFVQFIPQTQPKS